ncbi:hypothetical protein Daesc_005322 [Daldinia eschscholtzii]|uniref:Inhibitor of growth protein N-terminal histone-binding domain-containing protein n=1 Tax=Daldinia eschscholtzii TaxID=292717 RepID=A0AAX6MKK5_9PEZI
MATAVEANSERGGDLDGNISLGNKDSSSLMQTIPPLDTSNNGLESLNMRADPDAQATVTDFLDFTEYLPSDMVRSLTLIGKLDQAYIDASNAVNELTTTWAKLPTLPPDQRPAPVQLRKDISENLNRAVSSRIFSHAEAVRIHENVVRHYNRAKTIHAKLLAMRDNYPTAEEQKSPTQVKSPQAVRTPKITLRLDSNGQKIQRPPRITVPGEVLAPYEIDFNAYSSLSDESSEEEEEEDIPMSPPRRVATPSTRIKVVRPPKSPKPPKQKIPKPPRPPRTPANRSENTVPMMSTSTALAQLQPPPENAVPGSIDAPWLQLTQYELAKLRKRMKKNAVWNPSDTMIARELKNLGRGVEAYRAAQKQAEEEGRPFEAALPTPVVDAESGAKHPPEGAISAEALTADEVQLSNRGMKLNEAKKLKRESMARIAAEEAEESARKMMEAARIFFNHEDSPSVNGNAQDRAPETSHSQGKTNKPKTRKRKRNSMSETPVAEKPEGAQSVPANPPPSQTPSQSERPPLKRTKTETPVPLPQLTPRPPSVPPPPPATAASTAPTETPVPVPVPQLGKITQVAPTSKTPVPVPVPVSSDTSMVTTRSAASSSGATSPAPPSNAATTAPVKPPAETPVPPPIKTSTTPIPPPIREMPKRETRQNIQPATVSTPANHKQSSSRSNTPATTPAPESQPLPVRRPTSRGKAASQEPPTFAAERPRRTSTARNTPAPELRQPSKRTKRPAPGVVTTNSGGTSAIGKRKAAPRKKARGGNPKKERGASQQAEQEVEVEVDDDGNVIDPDEPRYCLCNRVSFGTMIQCDNVDVSATKTTATPARGDKKAHKKKLTTPHVQNCKQEWFHLECVGLTEIPARTTKWYCPECRKLLNIGGRGEVTSRGVKM